MNLVLRSAHLILRRACPTWGARLEGLRASRRTATSEIVPAAILRDARRAKRRAELLRMRSVGLSSSARSDWFHGIELLGVLLIEHGRREVGRAVSLGWPRRRARAGSAVFQCQSPW